jgi:nitroreductase
MRTSNDVVRTILARRSIRFGYERQRAVPHEIVETITACGLAAPSSKNAKPWRFHVVTSLATLDGIATAMETAPDVDSYVPHDPQTGRPHQHWQSTVVESAAVLREVPAAIVIENRGVFSGGLVTLRRATGEALAGSLAGYAFECVGIGTALANMWLAAISLGLSASFMGDVVIAEEHVAAQLGLDGDLIGLLALGYSDAAPLPALASPAETQTDHPVIYH